MLSGFSKIFELAVAQQLKSFFQNENLICTTQHGYVKGKSTQTAIFEFTKYILDCIEKHNVALGIFLDLYKAYDTLNQNILYLKLEKYGILGSMLK